MSGAEALAVVGIVSNILQLTEFCAKVTDRTLEFCGHAAQLPGSFSDLRVVLAMVKLNLKKLRARIEKPKPDQETLSTLKDLTKLIERDAKIIYHYLEKHLPAPNSSWTRVTFKAITSVFGEGKIKRATETIMQNIELLGQTVVSSLPTADEIAQAIAEKQTSGLDRQLSVIMDRMKTQAVSKTAINKTTFNNQKHEHRNHTTGHAINVKGHTQINNTYITVQMSYDELGTQLDQAAASKSSLMVPGTNLPFHPLLKSVSNPDLPGTASPRRHSEADALPPAGSGFIVDEEDDKDHAPTPRATSPRRDVHRRATTGITGTPRSRTPQPPMPGLVVGQGPPSHRHNLSASSRPQPTDTQSEIWDNRTVTGSMIPSEIWDSRTVAPSVVPSNIGSRLGLGEDLPSPLRSPLSPSSRHRSSFSRSSIPRVTPENLHNTVFELDGTDSPSDFAASLSGIETGSDVRTVSDAWSDTIVNPPDSDTMYTDGTSSIGSSITAVEDHDAINTVNAFIRSGAAAVTKNPSEAKRAYMSAMNTCKPIVAYSPAFSVRKFRALTLAAVGLSLCTMDRERYLNKARDYNAAAMTAANRTNDATLIHRVRLDEADLQMKEARMLEKKGAGSDATMRQFTAFGTYQGIASELEAAGVGPGGAGAYSVLDCNTRALALLGCGKMALILSRNPGTFRTSAGSIGAPRGYLEAALVSCAHGKNVYGARPDELALLLDTEAQVQKNLGSLGR